MSIYGTKHKIRFQKHLINRNFREEVSKSEFTSTILEEQAGLYCCFAHEKPSLEASCCDFQSVGVTNVTVNQCWVETSEDRDARTGHLKLYTSLPSVVVRAPADPIQRRADSWTGCQAVLGSAHWEETEIEAGMKSILANQLRFGSQASGGSC